MTDPLSSGPAGTALLSAVASQLQEAVFAVSRRDDVLMVNEAATRLLRLPLEKSCRVLTDLFPTGTAERVLASINRARETGAVLTTMETIRDGGGVDRVVEARLVPVRDGGGPVDTVAVMMREEGRRVVPRGDANGGNLIYRRVIESLPDCLNVKDRDGRFLIANDATAALMQANAAPDLIGKTDFDFYPADVAQTFMRDERKILDDGVPQVIAQEAVLKDGRRVQLSTLKVPFRDDAGRIIGLITHNRDVTEEKRLARELAVSQRQLADALASTPNGLVVFDASGRLIYSNERYRNMLPAVADLCVAGTTARDFMTAAFERGAFRFAPQRLSAALALPDGDLLRSLEGEEIQLADGRWIEARANFTATGDCLVVNIDVTRRKQALEALEESEERYRQVAEIMREAWWEESLPPGRVKNSRRLCEMLGLGEELLDCPLEDFLGRIHPEDVTRVQTAFYRAVHEGGDYKEIYRLRHADGHYLWMEDRGRILIRDRDGNPERFLGSLTDITQRREIELALEGSEDNFRHLFDDAPDAYVTLDAQDGRAIACNHAAARMLLGSREQLIGLRLDQVSPPLQPDGSSSHAAAEQRIRQILEKGYLRFEWMQRRFDGTDFWAEVTATAGAIRQRQVLHIAWREIGEIIAAKQAAEAASIAKSQFLSVMSHELRTPLNAIMGMFQLIGISAESDNTRQLASRGLGSSEHLLKLVEDILDFSSIEAGSVSPVQLPFRIESLVDEARRASASKRKDSVELSVRVDDSLAGHDLLGDPPRLKQVLDNLLGNALKFTEQGSVVLSVSRVGGTLEVPQVEFAVTDTGIGLTMDQQNRVFQPFTQVDMSNVRRFGGTGLGLAISQRLVALMGGASISVESRPGRGSRFAFTLPLALAKPPAPVALKPLPGGQRLSGVRILLVEDGETVRYATRVLLEAEGAHVEEAQDGGRGVNMVLAAAPPYDVVLMDMEMPVMDGINATRELRGRGYVRPIVALTASAFGHGREACLTAGMNDHVMKIAKIDELVAVLKRNLPR